MRLPALTFSNDLISRDEGLHFQFLCLLYREYLKPEERLTDARVHQIVGEALEIERAFINDVLDCALLGMNKDLMTEYVSHIANIVCDGLGHAPLSENSRTPFEFMDRLCFNMKANFFEGRVADYQRPKQQADCAVKDNHFLADF